MTAVLELRNATKTFPGVKALDRVGMTIGANEVVGLIGENGAGKSTLLKVLQGVYDLDEGEILIGGRVAEVKNPRDAFDHGIGMVFQEQSVLPTLTIAENIFLGRETEFVSHGFLNKRALNRAAAVELEKVHLGLSPSTLCADLSFAERQMVEIAKVLSLDSRIDSDIVVLLDEPTSVLESREIELLFKIVADLKTRAAFVFISHRIDEVLRVADRVYVMRDGKVVGEMPTAEASVPQLHELMVGHALHHEYYREARQGEPAESVLLDIDGLTAKGHFRDVSFQVRRGEILGVAGVIGSGRETLARCLAGLQPVDGGTIRIDGQPAAIDSAWRAAALGIGYIPRERKVEGVVGGISVAENMSLASLAEFAPRGVIHAERERSVAAEWIKRLDIKTPSGATPAGSLSGGNQQKVVLSKWRIADARIIILDHPTRGIDVGAKEDVYELIRDMTDEGLSVILLADTLEEVIGLSHRIIVMKDGLITARFDAPISAKPAQIDLIGHMV